MERQRSRQPTASEDPDGFDSEDAELIWRDAAQLQAEAARQLQERSIELADSREIGEHDHPSAFVADEVRAIAEAAGISREFVDLAMVRLKAHRAAGVSPAEADGWSERFLNHTERSLEVSRLIRASPDDVYEAMRRVFSSSKYSLELADVVGEGTEDRLLVFNLPSVYGGDGSTGYTPFSMSMAHAGFKQIFVSIHPMDAESCQVTIRSELQRIRKKNATAAAILLPLFAMVVALVPLVIAKEAVGVAGAGLAGVWAFATLLFSLIGLHGFRALFRWSIAKGETGLAGLLQVVETDARTGGDFTNVPGNS